MADLLFNRLKGFWLIFLALVINPCYAFESSFPFPFEFGHSSDIYLDVKKPVTKEVRQQRQVAEETLNQLGISKSPEAFVKYIKADDVRSIKLLLDAGFDPNTSINANYPIYYASRYNRPKIIYLLLEAGADPNRDFTSPVRFTILHKDYNSTKSLLDKGANPNYTDALTDETLLYTSLKKKQYDISRLLIESGAKQDRKSYNYISKKHLEERLGVTLN